MSGSSAPRYSRAFDRLHSSAARRATDRSAAASSSALLGQRQRAVGVAGQPLAIGLAALLRGEHQRLRVASRAALDGWVKRCGEIERAIGADRGIDRRPRIADRRAPLARRSASAAASLPVKAGSFSALRPADVDLEAVLDPVERVEPLALFCRAFLHRADQPAAQFGSRRDRDRQRAPRARRRAGSPVYSRLVEPGLPTTKVASPSLGARGFHLRWPGVATGWPFS